MIAMIDGWPVSEEQVQEALEGTATFLIDTYTSEESKQFYLVSYGAPVITPMKLVPEEDYMVWVHLLPGETPEQAATGAEVSSVIVLTDDPSEVPPSEPETEPSE